MSEPELWRPPEGQRRHPLAVMLGLLAGLVLGFFALPYAGVLVADSVADSSGGGGGSLITLALLPLLLGAALLIPRKLRVVGAGVVMGLAVGLIVGSASCLGLIGIFAASYN
jgi:hypothetical protein